jgi:hypothetical protein
MKKMLFATLMSLSICSLSAYSPYANDQANADFYEVDCYDPCNSMCISDCVTQKKGISIDVDFLWWDTRADNLSTSVSLTDTVTDLTTTNVYSFDYQWKPGYRIELGYLTCLGGYEVDLFAKWTWFRTSYTRDLEITNGVNQSTSIRDALITLDSSAPGDSIYHVTSSFLYEKLDVGLMSDVFQIGYFTFKPSAAATYVYIQDAYRGIATRTDIEAETIGLTNGKFSGAGITIGAHVVYPIRCDMFLYSNTEFSGLWGEVKQNARVYTDNFLFPSSESIYNKNYWTGRIIVAQELGIGYSACIRSFPASIHLGWQFLYLPNFNMITTTGALSDRTVNGLVVGAALGF